MSWWCSFLVKIHRSKLSTLPNCGCTIMDLFIHHLNIQIRWKTAVLIWQWFVSAIIFQRSFGGGRGCWVWKGSVSFVPVFFFSFKKGIFLPQLWNRSLFFLLHMLIQMQHEKQRRSFASSSKKILWCKWCRIMYPTLTSFC